MKTHCVYVDIPVHPSAIHKDEAWANIACFTSRDKRKARKKAENFLLKRYGIKPKHAAAFLVIGGW